MASAARCPAATASTTVAGPTTASSVSELSADVGRYLRNEPVEASPPGATYRLRKFVRRHRASVAAAAGVVLALWLSAWACPAAAASLQVRVLDMDGEPVPDVAVFVGQQGAGKDSGAPKPAVMDQRNRRFVPHILVVQKGAEVDADVIVMCGVRFMAETAKILNPSKTVLIPSQKAGCSLAESITAAEVRALKAQFPGVPVVTYVNSSAEVKAESDICCTSGNASMQVWARTACR